MNNRSPLIAALILTYNDSQIVKSCIETVMGSDYQDLEIYLIDNGSRNEVLVDIKQCYPKLNIFALPENLGYSGAFNFVINNLMSIPDRKFSYFWILNNDLEVKKDTLSKIVKVISNQPKIGFAGPETMKRGNLSEHDQWITLFPNPKNPGKIFLNDELEYGSAEMIDIAYVVGHCMLVKRELIEEVGLMREFFIYFEEVEWQYRAKQVGWRSVAVPSSIAYHDRHSFMKPYNTYLRTRNYLFYNRSVLESNPSFFKFFVYNSFFLFKDGIVSIVKGSYDMKHAKNFFIGIFHGYFRKLPSYKRYN
jgi:GT2 family glycosyltransferase